MGPEVFESLHGAVRSLRSGGPFEAAPYDPVPEAAAPEGAGAGVSWWTPEAEAEVDPFGDRVWVDGVAVGRGTPVVLRPSRRADAHDLFLSGMAATVQAVLQDVDGNTQVAVSVLDDDGTEVQLGHGRYLFFFPDEIEPTEARP